ncbi:thiol:disulfide interchange protein [Paenibacillus sp. J31TS4]|uniref:TlpA disulfide reductase family protein n=1 Tax=Paenibacillus sp. J31TS4 TaxID=2807195 RepID=UPI001B0FBB10|nr:TlpA disulfide reductase family protein [Paenibacillus sp. J31TS4]GIP37985.1 thiol:disulfide interchange protein [Paenibacillus sp. J31TS4]
MKRTLAVLAAVLVLAGLAVYQHITSQDKQAALPAETAPKAGYLAPPFELGTLEGTNLRVGGAREKPLLLNFWASWCWPCEQEAPDLQRLYAKYGDKFDLYAVNLTANDKLADAESFVKRFGLSFPILLDKEGKAGDLYGIRFIPTSFLIDKNGVVQEIIHLQEPKELEKTIQRLIGGK